jgi:hypothetical protein
MSQQYSSRMINIYDGCGLIDSILAGATDEECDERVEQWAQRRRLDLEILEWYVTS